MALNVDEQKFNDFKTQTRMKIYFGGKIGGKQTFSTSLFSVIQKR